VEDMITGKEISFFLHIYIFFRTFAPANQEFADIIKKRLLMLVLAVRKLETFMQPKSRVQ
jgi:hypothetical protein